jgi:hypothetical protein
MPQKLFYHLSMKDDFNAKFYLLHNFFLDGFYRDGDYKDNKIAKKHLENLLLDMRQLYIEKYISNNTLGTNGKVIKEDKQE